MQSVDSEIVLACNLPTPVLTVLVLQVNGYQPQPVLLRALPRRRHLLNIQPESIDKMSIVCFPLAFTFFNVSAGRAEE